MRIRQVGVLTLLLLVTTTLGCSTSLTPAPEHAQQDATLSALRQLPTPLELLALPGGRQASHYDISVDGCTCLAGALPRQRVTTGTGGPGSADFSPYWLDSAPALDGMAFGVYEFSASCYRQGSFSIGADWSVIPSGGGLWYGVSDFEHNRWDWFKGEIGDWTRISALQNYNDYSERLFVVVALLGTAPATLESLVLGDDSAEIIVHYLKLGIDALSSIAVNGPLLVNGYPAVVAVDGNGGGQLQYMVASDTAGEYWMVQPKFVGDAEPSTPGFSLIDGNPAVAFREKLFKNVLYCRANDTFGGDWGSPVMAVNQSNPASGAICLFDQGEAPALVFVNERWTPNWQSVEYVCALTRDGSSWPSYALVMDSDTTGGTHFDHPRAMLVSGKPTVAYQSCDDTISFDNIIAFRSAQDSEGLDWNELHEVVCYGMLGDFYFGNVSLVDLGGKPGVGYQLNDPPPDERGTLATFKPALDPAGADWQSVFWNLYGNSVDYHVIKFASFTDFTVAGHHGLLSLAMHELTDGTQRGEAFFFPVQPDGTIDFGGERLHRHLLTQAGDPVLVQYGTLNLLAVSDGSYLSIHMLASGNEDGQTATTCLFSRFQIPVSQLQALFD